MNHIYLKGLCCTLLVLFLLNFSSAQTNLQLPQKSPKATVSYTIGLTEITINYSSPAVAGRTIWGELEPFDKVWRAGANAATTIEFSTDVKIEGEELSRGKYSFFLIPRDGAPWTAIFNKIPDQWGAFAYDSEQDALRVDINPRTSVVSEERLTFAIHDRGIDKGFIRLGWDKIRLYIRVQVDAIGEGITNINKALEEAKEEEKWQIYAAGADFLAGADQNLEQAVEWADKSTSLFQHSWNHWIKAQVQAKQGNIKEALATAKKCHELGATESDGFYANAKGEIERISREWKE